MNYPFRQPYHERVTQIMRDMRAQGVRPSTILTYLADTGTPVFDRLMYFHYALDLPLASAIKEIGYWEPDGTGHYSNAEIDELLQELMSRPKLMHQRQ